MASATISVADCPVTSTSASAATTCDLAMARAARITAARKELLPPLRPFRTHRYIGGGRHRT